MPQPRGDLAGIGLGNTLDEVVEAQLFVRLQERVSQAIPTLGSPVESEHVPL